jgi:hypothetical protein
VLLFEKWQDRGRRLLSREEYRRFRSAMNRMVGYLDRQYEIHRAFPMELLPEEADWSEKDPDDAHLQRLARNAQADCVLSTNVRDFPNPDRVGNWVRGSLVGIVWIQPDDLFHLLMRPLEDLGQA